MLNWNSNSVFPIIILMASVHLKKQNKTFLVLQTQGARGILPPGHSLPVPHLAMSTPPSSCLPPYFPVHYVPATVVSMPLVIPPKSSLSLLWASPPVASPRYIAPSSPPGWLHHFNLSSEVSFWMQESEEIN